MERVKRLAGLVLLIAVVSFCVSVAVFSWMRKDALEKMLAMQEVLVVQGLVAGTAAAQNLVNANFQGAEENLYSTLGINMAFFKADL